MTQQEKDALLGQVVRECGEHEKELRTLIVATQQLGARLRNFGDLLNQSTFGVVTETETHGLLISSMMGALMTDSYKDVLDYERIAKLEEQVRHHACELHRLRGQRAQFGV